MILPGAQCKGGSVVAEDIQRKAEGRKKDSARPAGPKWSRAIWQAEAARSTG